MLVNNTSTTSKRSLWPPETKGLWVTGAGVSQLRLSDGKWYDDWASALGANTLGYGWKCERLFRPAVSLPWLIERDFADDFCKAMHVEAVRFFKSGSDAMSCAVRCARGFTRRDFVVVFDKSYHGTGDWFGPALWSKLGIADNYCTIVQPFGAEISVSHPEQIAAICVEPVPKSIELPPDGWLNHLREVCDKHGIILISDEVVLGYRCDLEGYLQRSGLAADLYAYGKAMGQGAAIAAAAGRADILGLLGEEQGVHFSGTNSGEPTSLYIAAETLRVYESDDVCGKLDAKGRMLKQMFHDHGFATKGLNQRFAVVGCDMETTRFCFKNGILFPGWACMALSHTDEQCQKLVEVVTQWRDDA